MTETNLSTREAEVIIDGGRLPGRADLDDVVELAAFMRASRDVEPPPPMRESLIWLLDAGEHRQN